MAGNVRSQVVGREAMAASGLVLIALTAAVAVASRTSVHGSGGVISGGSGAGRAVETALLAFGLVAWLAVTALVVAALWPSTLRRRKRDPEDVFEAYRPEMSLWVKVVMVALPALLFAGVVAVIASIHTHGGGPVATSLGHPAGPGPLGTATPTHTSTTPTAAGGSAALTPALVFVAAVVIVAVAVLIMTRRRRRPPPATDARLRGPLAEAVEWSLEDLRREPDPRRAVIAAYARMERMLALEGLSRRAYEAPLEYLGRVLAQAHVSGPAIRRLTSLFQEAKFSPHAIGQAERAHAVETLAVIRDEIRGE